MKFRIERWDGAGEPTAEGLRDRLRASRCSATEWSDPPGRTYESHTHEQDEVIAIVVGGITFTVADVDYPLSPGDILFLPAGTLHAAQAHATQGATYLIGTRASKKGAP